MSSPESRRCGSIKSGFLIKPAGLQLQCFQSVEGSQGVTINKIKPEMQQSCHAKEATMVSWLTKATCIKLPLGINQTKSTIFTFIECRCTCCWNSPYGTIRPSVSFIHVASLPTPQIHNYFNNIAPFFLRKGPRNHTIIFTLFIMSSKQKIEVYVMFTSGKLF